MSQAPVRPTPSSTTSAPSVASGAALITSGTSTLGVPTPVPSRSPQLLRRLQVVVALALLIAGALSVWVVTDLRGDLASAPNLAEQYARLGQVQHSLSAAARLADQSVLLGESADGANATAAIDQVVHASGLLVEAAKERPQDADAVQAIGGNVLRFSLVLSSAVGAPQAQALPRLATAQTQLGDLLGQIDQLQAQLATEAAGRPWSQSTPAVALAGVAMAAVVAWVAWVVARRSHRVLNLGLAAAVIALFVVIGLTATAQDVAANASQASRSTQFTHVVNTTNAVRHLDAAQQVLTTAVLTQAWNATTKNTYALEFTAASAAARVEGLPQPNDVDTAKEALATRMNQGNWKAATTNLLDTGSDGLSAAADAFRTSASTASDGAVADAAAAPTDARASLVAELVLIVAVALAGAALGVLGLFQRLREYR